MELEPRPRCCSEKNLILLKRMRFMKRLMTLALALSFLGATTAVTFAQETKKEESGKKSKKKSGKKKTEEPKKSGD